MNPISFFVPGEPKAQPRPRAFARRLPNGKTIVRAYEAGTAEGWKSAIAITAKPFIPFPPLQGPLRVDLVFYFPRPKAHFNAKGLKPDAPTWHTGRPDRDNLDKAVLDCLSSIGMWGDDCQVCAGLIEKCYGSGLSPGVRVTIQPLNQTVWEPPKMEIASTCKP